MNVRVVLHRPQNVVNIAVVTRAMLNFGLRDLRLVEPHEYDPRRIEGIAHKAGPILERTAIFDTLDEALHDLTHVTGLTARGRTVKRNLQRPSEAAEMIASLPASHRPAILLGPEDKGLTNEELDRCQRIVTIPTTPEFSSLNLAQAATVMLYELFKAQANPPFKPPRHRAEPADRQRLEELFAESERALAAFEFFKSHTRPSIMRTVREVGHRAMLDEREAALLRAMCYEIQHFLRRKGVNP